MLAKLTQIHMLILKLGLHHNPLVLTKFVVTASHFDAMHCTSSFIFLDNDRPAPHRDTFLFNTLIRAFAHPAAHSKPRTLRLYSAMLCHNVLPNKFTFLFLLKACTGLADLPLTKRLHSSILKFGYDRGPSCRSREEEL